MYATMLLLYASLVRVSKNDSSFFEMFLAVFSGMPISLILQNKCTGLMRWVSQFLMMVPSCVWVAVFS